MSKGSNRRPEDKDKFAAGWDTIFNKMIKTHPKRIWEYFGHDLHKNEDHYKCSECGYRLELATYDKPDDITCPSCEK